MDNSVHTMIIATAAVVLVIRMTIYSYSKRETLDPFSKTCSSILMVFILFCADRTKQSTFPSLLERHVGWRVSLSLLRIERLEV